MGQSFPSFKITKTQDVLKLPLLAAALDRFGPEAKVADLAKLPTEVVARCSQ